MPTLYRILRQADWQAARARGVFSGSEHDQRDGFIHLSAVHQVRATAAKHYAGVSDLVLLSIGSEALSATGTVLKWEVSRGGDRFPHLYGDLELSVVERVEPLPLGPDGQHMFPTLND